MSYTTARDTIAVEGSLEILSRRGTRIRQREVLPMLERAETMVTDSYTTPWDVIFARPDADGKGQ